RHAFIAHAYVGFRPGPIQHIEYPVTPHSNVDRVVKASAQLGIEANGMAVAGQVLGTHSFLPGGRACRPCADAVAPEGGQARSYSRIETMSCNRSLTRAAAAVSSAPKSRSPSTVAYAMSSRRVLSATVSGPMRSRQASTSCAGDSMGPCARIRAMMALTPGLSTSANCREAKLTRAINVAVLIHSLPVCQPSTLGGSSSCYPIYPVSKANSMSFN